MRSMIVTLRTAMTTHTKPFKRNTMHTCACRHVSILSVMGISCTSILLVSVLGAVVEDPSRHRLPVQVHLHVYSP